MPGGQGQIAYAQAVVTERFTEANLLFVLDQLIKGVIGAITGLIGGIAAFLPIPGLQGLVGFINAVIRMSLTYVDEIILGYNIRTGSDAPFETARQGVVLYAQNGKPMVKNAIWLTSSCGCVTHRHLPLHAGARRRHPLRHARATGGWAFVLAIVFAWAFKAALLEPFAIAALMQVYFRDHRGPGAEPGMGPPARRSVRKIPRVEGQGGGIAGRHLGPGRRAGGLTDLAARLLRGARADTQDPGAFTSARTPPAAASRDLDCPARDDFPSH